MYPLGANYDGSGVNFALFSQVADKVELCLFDEDDKETRIEMTEKEKELFRKSLVDKLRITMDTEGNLSIGLS